MLEVACAIIVNNGKILVTQHSGDSDHPFQWEFPGGKLKTGETFEDCIIREINEELEIEIRILTRMHSVKWDYGIKKIELVPFLCSIKSGEIRLTEHLHFLWKDPESLYELDFSAADYELINLHSNQLILEEYFREYMNNS